MPPQKDLAEASRQLIEYLVEGSVSGVRSLYTGPADIDDPFAGHQIDGGFERLIKTWRPVQEARVTSLEVTHSTVGEGHVGTEIDLALARQGNTNKLAIVVVSEVDSAGSFIRTRLYYRRANVDGHQHFRDRMLQDEIEYEFHPTIRRYQDALLNRKLDAFLATFAEDAYFDGHGGPQSDTGELVDLRLGLGMGRYVGHDQLRQAIGQMMDIGNEEGPDGRLEHVNAFTDGTTTVLEFNILRPDQNRIHAGVACYELNADGLLKAARVYDEAW